MGTAVQLTTLLLSPAATTGLPPTRARLSLLRPYVYPSDYTLFSPTFVRLWSTSAPSHLLAPYNFRRAAAAAGVQVGSAVLQDAAATTMVMAGAYALVSAFDNLTQRNLIEQNSTSIEARYFAALVPISNCLKLIVHGLSLATDEGLIKSVTREGNPQELLRGPLYYVLILILCAVVFWRESPIGVISLAMMCGGDGIADIMGRRFGFLKIPYNQQKSWAGSISMFLFGFVISTGMLYYFSALGYFQLDWIWTMERVALVSLVATVVESLPINGVVDDNISVPLASMIIAFLSFGY